MSSNLNKQKSSTNFKQTLHDLNNIFTSTIISTEILEKIISENNEAAKLIATIKTNSLRANDILNTLEIDSVKQKSNISIEDVALDIIATIKPTLPKYIELKFHFEKELNKVYANYTDLYRLFLNLIINAIESISHSGEITFSAKNSDELDSALISIKDSGHGIPTQKLKTVFEQNYSTKNKKSNSGLGLSIAKEIIEENNGSIEVYSKVKSGTEFVVTFPAIRKVKTDKNYAGYSTILLADDDQNILELFSDLLESYNYIVITALNGKSALNEFKKGNFDLIIVDKTMPEIDGMECIKQIRKDDYAIPIILMTGSQETIDQEYPNLNINKKIKKPWDFENMLKVIQELLI